MSKKGYNIYKRKDNRWEGRYKCGFTDSGKTAYKSVYGKTYGLCKEKLITAMQNSNSTRTVKETNMTIKNLLDKWLENISVKVKDSTMNTYRNIIKNYILPSMGGMLLNSVTTDFLNGFVKKLVNSGRKDGKGGLSPKTVLNIIGVLKAAFKYGEKNHNTDNPTAFVTMPKIQKKKIDVLSDEEIKKIRNYCKEHKSYFTLAYDLCISTGIRIGELCALQCSDIDLEKGILHIRKTVQRVKSNQTDTKRKTMVIQDKPKTENSLREIPLPIEVIEKLKIYTAEKEKEDYIFTNDNKNPLDIRSMQKKFKTVLKNSGVRNVNFHVLRHTFATMWVNASLDIKGLSEILGHSNINTTLSLYVHPSVDEKRKQINSLYLLHN